MSESHSQSLDMSSNEKLVQKSVSKNSHSFDDRICDDLSEVLLKFLQLKDKLRLECVSKQFQRTVFQKQFTITLDSHLQPNYEMIEQIEDKVFERNYMTSIELLLKKCPNIQTINTYIKNRIFRSILPLITKYCDKLIEFNVSLDDSTYPQLSEEFYRKFGSKLKYILCGNELELNLFPNLKSLNKYHYPTTSPEYVLPLNLLNLKELYITLNEGNKHLFREVLKKFLKIKHLCLSVESNDQMAVFNAFKESPVLQNLIELKYRTNCEQNGKQFLDSLKRLTKKFPKLKSIEIGFLLVKVFSNLRQQLSLLKAFSDLKRLDLMLTFRTDNDHDTFSFKPFKEHSNITHLTLLFDVKQLNAKILTNIGIYLPKLQFLFILREIITDEEGVTQMAESLSRLSYLQTIELGFIDQYICDLMSVKIAEKCRKIRNIYIYNYYD